MYVSPWLNRFRNRISRKSTRVTRAKSRVRQRRGERLEDRTLLTVVGTLVGTGGALDPVTLSIFEDAGEDLVVRSDVLTGEVQVFADGVASTNIPTVLAADLEVLEIFGGDDDTSIDLSLLNSGIFTSLTSISVNAADGNDTLTGSDSFAETLRGSDGDDVIDGGDQNDSLDGGNGDDSILGGLGDDTIDADDGNDTVDGEGGADNIIGGDGADDISGSAGDDTIDSGQGADLVDGGADDDSIQGGFGMDTLMGGLGNDSVRGGSDDDSILGGEGEDSLFGQGGEDTLLGEAGDDSLEGGTSNDSLVGGDGDDFAVGDLGNDTVAGGDGNDFLLGGGGDDVLNGNDGNDTILGNSGNDTIEGGPGADSMVGGNGDDVIGSLASISISDVAVNEGSSSSVAFSTDFESGVPAEFSGFTTTEPVQGYAGVGTGTNLFAGSFLRNDSGGDPSAGGTTPQTPTTLTLTNLPAHTSIDINFLLAIIGSWNSATDPQGPDIFNVTVDGTSVFSENFRNFAPFPGSQGYAPPPGTLLTPNLADLFTETPAFNDTAYDMNLEPAFNDIPHTSSTLVIEWFADGAGFEGQENESWALDNVEVLLNGVSNQVDATFTVSLSAPAGDVITVDYATSDSSATAGADYVGETGVVTFQPGDQAANITITVLADDVAEGDEFFTVDLSNASGGTQITDSQGVGAILDDDEQLVDIFLLFDRTTSFNNAFPSLQMAFPTIVSDLQMTLPTANFAYGIGVFQDFSTGGGARPFTLTQPIVESTTPQFTAATDAAILRAVPQGGNGDIPETPLEGLFQVATGVGFDGNGDGDTSDSGPAGLLSTQLTPGTGGDVPAFASFLPDGTPGSPVLSPSGNIGGVGFRENSQRIVLLATDAPFKFPVDAATDYTGIGGVTVPAADIQVSGSTAVPAGAATIQGTVDALVGAGIQVIGLGGLTTLGIFDPNDPTDAPRRPLEAFATLTGAINTTSSPIVSGIPGDDIDPGEPLYLTIDTASASVIATAITSAVLATVTTVVPPIPPAVLDGDDTLRGGNGNDTLLGGNGNDVIDGGNGDDSISGAAGNDEIAGRSGNDSIEAGSGDDTLEGNGGNDTLGAGSGNDIYIWTGAVDGTDILADATGFQTLNVNADATANSLTVDQNSSMLRVSEGAGSITINDSVASVNVNGGDGDDVITLTGLSGSRALLLTINGDAGNDTINASSTTLGSLVAFFNGNDGNDTISGSLSRDTINGGNDDDSILGNSGDDEINGDDGTDMLIGGEGNDDIDGGLGSDILQGGDDDDTLTGGAGDDSLDGEAGDDTVDGGIGNDTLVGSFGNDLILGGSGADFVFAGAGNDRISGGTGDDFIRGHSGDDQIKGGDGDDTIRADQGDDTINGGDGDDSLESGDGFNIVNADDGNDTVIAGRQSDTIIGGDGNDLVFAGGGRDSVYGGEGDDTLRGNGSSDRFNSGEGDNDVIADLAGVEFDDLTLAISTSVLSALAELDTF